jgi:hypothetical protein
VAQRPARQCAAHRPCSASIRSATRSRPSIVRWHGRRRVERFVRRLYERPSRRIRRRWSTYVNFPAPRVTSTCRFWIFACFNVIPRVARPVPRAYLARWQESFAVGAPLVLAEIGAIRGAQGEAAPAEEHRLGRWRARLPEAARARSSLLMVPTSGIIAAGFEDRKTGDYRG